jgi:hypothetical protein
MDKKAIIDSPNLIRTHQIIDRCLSYAVIKKDRLSTCQHFSDVLRAIVSVMFGCVLVGLGN